MIPLYKLLKTHNFNIDNLSLITKSKNKFIYSCNVEGQKTILKYFKGKYQLEKFNNEKNFYIEKNKFNIFKVPKLILEIKNNQEAILLISKINGKKINYFKSLFIKINISSKKNINAEKYFNVKKYGKKINNLIKKNYKTYNIKISESHGDLIHWNIINFKKKLYTYDFEFFSKERNIYFDFFKLYFLPVIHKKIKFNIFNIKFFNNIFIFIFFMFTKLKKIKISFKDFRAQYVFFLIELYTLIKNENKFNNVSNSLYKDLEKNIRIKLASE